MWIFNAKACAVSYHRGGKELSKEEIQKILSINEPTEWEHTFKVTRDEYRAESGNYAVYDPIKKSLFVATPEYLKLRTFLARKDAEGL